MSDLRAMKGAEYSDGALYSIIHRWTKEGWIEKTSHRTYKKLKYPSRVA
jgi:DNA-binding PadR family transcriptional regulator